MDTVYVLINTQLQMPAGKVVAQAVHAALNLVADSMNYTDNPFEQWYLNNPNAVIILDGQNENVMQNLENYLLNSNLPARYFDYQDEGEMFKKTALACGPFPKDHPMVKAVFSQFKLYKDNTTEMKLDMSLDHNRYLTSKLDNIEKTLTSIRELTEFGINSRSRDLQRIIKQIYKELNQAIKNNCDF